jgi:CRP/FNR family transcriptional regulator, cyclic AMP receptor protein
MTTNIADKVNWHFASHRLQYYSKGQILIHAGEEPAAIYYLVRGKVRQYNISDRGDEVIVNIFKPGAFFPMLPALTGLPNKYFFDAETDIEVRPAPIDETLTFIMNDPDVMLDLLTRVYRGMDGLLGRIVHLMSGSARERLVYEIQTECRRFGKANQDGSNLITITEGDLAGRAGLSRETVSREMHKMSKAGLVDMNHGSILVKDPLGL